MNIGLSAPLGDYASLHYWPAQINRVQEAKAMSPVAEKFAQAHGMATKKTRVEP